PANAPGFSLCPAPAGQTLRFLGYATGLGQLAYEPLAAVNANAGRGFFTRALLAGLRGGARDETGAVTSVGLATYVQKSVEDLTKDTPVRQKVQVIGDYVPAIVFRQATGERPKRTVVLRFPPSFTSS